MIESHGDVMESLVTARLHLLHPCSPPWPYPGLWMSQIPQDHTSPSPLPPGEAAARLSPEGNSGMTTAWAEGTCPPAPTCLCWLLAPGPAREQQPGAALGRCGGRTCCLAPRTTGMGAEIPAGSPAQHHPGPFPWPLGQPGHGADQTQPWRLGLALCPEAARRGASRLLPLAAGHPLPMQGAAAPRRAARPRSAPSSTFLLLPAERGKREQRSLHLPLVGTGRTGDPFSPAHGGARGGGAAGPVPLPCPSPAPRGAALLTVRSLHLSA